VPLRRKRIRKSTVVVPRILKSDGRNVFTTMFTNVFNIIGLQTFAGFFSEYCNADLTYVFEMTPSLTQ
jgi:hypothetical protein